MERVYDYDGKREISPLEYYITKTVVYAILRTVTVLIGPMIKISEWADKL